MATLLALTLANRVFNGEDGNLSVAHGQHVAAAAQVGDKIRLLAMPAGSKVYDVKLVNAALGASSTVSVGWEYVDGSAGGSATAFHNAVATNAAATTRSAGAPVQIDKDWYLTATIGGAAATGQIDVVPSYEIVGAP